MEGGGEGARVPAGEVAAATASQMAADGDMWSGVDKIISYGEDLLGVLRNRSGGEAEVQVGAGARMLKSACLSESADLERQLKECQEKIDSYKEKIDKAKAETIADDDLNAWQNKLEEKLQEEQQLRQDLTVRDELDNLDCQRASIEERRDSIKKKQKEKQKAEYILSTLVGATNIIPDLEDKDKISGYIVDKNGKKTAKFGFDQTKPQFEICNELWKKILEL
ncbi:hypothetical protein ACP4OV_031822 [Aristida adscensionis]